MILKVPCNLNGSVILSSNDLQALKEHWFPSGFNDLQLEMLLEISERKIQVFLKPKDLNEV